jgi:protein phosphatase
LEREGFRHVFVLESTEEVDDVTLERQPLWNNLRHEHGPFDIIGDIHGCYDELLELLKKLKYELRNYGDGTPEVIPPPGRNWFFSATLLIADLQFRRC